MNVLLIFAVFISFLALLKDLLKSNFQWENGLYLSIFLLAATVIPLLINIIIFIKSDKPKLKTIIKEVIKTILLDASEDFMTKKCLNEKWIYCNYSSFDLSVSNGGSYWAIGRFDFDSKLDIKHVMQWSINLEETLPFCNFSKMVFKNISTLCYEVAETNSTLCSINIIKLLKILNSNMVFKIIDDKKFELIDGSNWKGVLDLSHFKFSLKKCGRLETYWVCINDEELFIINLLNHRNLITHFVKNHETTDFKIDTPISFKIGILNFVVTSEKLTLFYKGKHFKSIKIPLIKATSFMTLIHVLKKWEVEPEKGILTDNCNLNDKRGGAVILHCLSLTQLIDNIVLFDKNILSLYKLNLPSGKYQTENNDLDLDVLSAIKDKTMENLLGSINYASLKKIVGIYFDLGNDETQKLLVQLINLKSQIGIKKSVKLPNYKLKKCLVDVSYFIGMINYGKISYLDKKINISKEAVEISKIHSKLDIKDMSQKKSFDEILLKNAGTKYSKLKGGMNFQSLGVNAVEEIDAFNKMKSKSLFRTKDYEKHKEATASIKGKIIRCYKNALVEGFAKESLNSLFVRDLLLAKFNFSENKTKNANLDWERKANQAYDKKVKKLKTKSKINSKRYEKQYKETFLAREEKKVGIKFQKISNLKELNSKSWKILQTKVKNSEKEVPLRNYYGLLNSIDEEKKNLYKTEIKSYSNYIKSCEERGRKKKELEKGKEKELEEKEEKKKSLEKEKELASAIAVKSVLAKLEKENLNRLNNKKECIDKLLNWNFSEKTMDFLANKKNKKLKNSLTATIELVKKGEYNRAINGWPVKDDKPANSSFRWEINDLLQNAAYEPSIFKK